MIKTGFLHLVSAFLKLPLPIDRVYAFFADAWNLERITPPELRFHITTPHPLHMSTGTLIDYRMHLFGIPLRWRTVISLWDPPHRFFDEQLEGPYAEWVHLHQFDEQGRQTTVRDTVEFRLPLWPLGEMTLPLVAVQLHRIFSFRQLKTAAILAGEGAPVESSVDLHFSHSQRRIQRVRSAS